MYISCCNYILYWVFWSYKLQVVTFNNRWLHLDNQSEGGILLSPVNMVHGNMMFFLYIPNFHIYIYMLIYMYHVYMLHWCQIFNCKIDMYIYIHYLYTFKPYMYSLIFLWSLHLFILNEQCTTKHVLKQKWLSILQTMTCTTISYNLSMIETSMRILATT